MSENEKAEQAERVKATTVEPLAELSAADRWLADVSARVTAIVADFMPCGDLADEEAYQQAKRDRAALRKRIGELDGERKDMSRPVEDAVKAFRAASRQVTAPLDALEAGYRDAIRGYEEAWHGRRMALLDQTYQDMAPWLRDAVPLTELVARFGVEGKWARRGTTDAAAVRGLEDAVAKVADGERQLEAVEFRSPSERDAARSQYFERLDVGEVLAWLNETRERADRVAELDARRAEQQQAEQQQAEQQQAEQQAQPQPKPDTEQVWTYEVTVPMGKVREFVAAMRGIEGVHGRRVR